MCIRDRQTVVHFYPSAICIDFLLFYRMIFPPYFLYLFFFTYHNFYHYLTDSICGPFSNLTQHYVLQLACYSFTSSLLYISVSVMFLYSCIYTSYKNKLFSDVCRNVCCMFEFRMQSASVLLYTSIILLLTLLCSALVEKIVKKLIY